VDQAQNNLDSLKAGPTASDLATAQAAVDQAQASLQSAQLKLKNAALVAPFSGTITDVPVTVGQTVAAGTTVAELVDTSRYHIDMNVSETDISTLKVNQPVDLTFDALPDLVYTGTVTYINPKATVAQGVVSYLTTVTLDPKAAGSALRAGMSATAAVITQQRTNALLVPNRAVRTEGRQKVVYVVGPGGTQIRVPVETGLTNDTSTEITGTTPLREGDDLVISSTTSGATRPAGGGLINLGGGGRR
jgi:HlyD family secretion protein